MDALHPAQSGPGAVGGEYPQRRQLIPMLLSPPTRVPLEGPGSAIVLAGEDRLVLLIENPSRPSTSFLAGFDLSGERLWSRPVASYYQGPLRATSDGAVWLTLAGCLCELRDGEFSRSVATPVEPGEHVGGLLLAPEGFIVSLYRRTPAFARAPWLGRVARLRSNGAVVWSTVLPAMLGDASDGTWRPGNWAADHYVPYPLLLAGDRLLASFLDGSGLGRSYCLDATAGRHLWTTPPKPFFSKAVAGPGRFLIGYDGYGETETWLYDADGVRLDRWRSHGEYVVSETGSILVVDRAVGRLEKGGSVRRGPDLGGNGSSYPALTEDGSVVFWRDGKLQLLDEQDRSAVLIADAEGLPDDRVVSRTLLCPDGTLAFTVGAELWLARTSLVLQTGAPWACAEGNVHGNPASASPP